MPIRNLDQLFRNEATLSYLSELAGPGQKARVREISACLGGGAAYCVLCTAVQFHPAGRVFPVDLGATHATLCGSSVSPAGVRGGSFRRVI